MSRPISSGANSTISVSTEKLISIYWLNLSLISLQSSASANMLNMAIILKKRTKRGEKHDIYHTFVTFKKWYEAKPRTYYNFKTTGI